MKNITLFGGFAQDLLGQEREIAVKNGGNMFFFVQF
jgi:hypothetical protein